MAKYNDIRFLKDFDKETLDEIGLRPLHIKCFMRKIEIYMDEVKLLKEWLEDIVNKQKVKGKFNNVTIDGLIDKFENYGVTTFETLYKYIKTKDDLEKMIIGDDDETKFNKQIYNVLWNEMEKIESKQSQRMSIVSQSYSQVNLSLLGIDNDNNSRNLEEYAFKFAPIAEQNSIDNNLDDSLGNVSIDNEGDETAYIEH